MNYSKSFIFFSLFLLIPSFSQAVEGYKKFKFGMNKKQVIETKFCTFEDAYVVKGVEALSCADFPFGGAITEGFFYFPKGKLLRIGFQVLAESVPAVIESMSKKYGPPSSSSPESSFEVVDKLPNREAYVAFDHNTVYIKIFSDENMTQFVMLVYTSPKYDVLLKKIQKEAVKDDI